MKTNQTETVNPMTQTPPIADDAVRGRSEPVLLFAKALMVHQDGIVPVQVAYYSGRTKEWYDNRTGDLVDRECIVGWKPISGL